MKRAGNFTILSYGNVSVMKIEDKILYSEHENDYH